LESVSGSLQSIRKCRGEACRDFSKPEALFIRRDSFGASSRIRAHTRLTSRERQRLDCASSHHWSRELQTLGPTVRLMPPAYVKPYVKRHKNDSVDAEAICEDRAKFKLRRYRKA
jgi:hypothetical protein